MSRPTAIFGSDGFTNYDDVIPRCMDAGCAPRNVVNPPVDRKEWKPAFESRVNSAMAQLKRGVSLADVRAEHGIIVTRTAVKQLLPSARFL